MSIGATSIGQIGLDLVVNQNQFTSQMNGITKLAKKAGATLAAAFGVKKLIDFSKKCLELGSDLAEVQNVVDVTFPAMTAQVDKFAKSAAASFGLSETMAKQYTGTFGAMAKAFGFTEKQAYDMSTTLTGLAGDVASFYNLSQDEAYTKLKSVFTGETESLKDLGVVMTQTALDSYALANGFGKTTSAMSEAEKVALRYQFVQEQLSAATGDFARTSGSWANQIKILQLQMQSFMATVGQGMINLFTPVIKVINVLISKLMILANAFKSFTELITGNKSGITTAADDAGASLGSASEAADSLSESTQGVGDAAKKAAKEMKALMGFDRINKLDSQIDTESTGSAGSNGGVENIDFGSLSTGETVIDKVNDEFTELFQNILKYTEPTTKALKKLYEEGLAKLKKFALGSLKDFYTDFLIPVGKWAMGKGLPEFINVLNNGLMKVNFDKIRKSLDNLWKALTPFTINVGEGLLWFWKNVLVPLGTWTANEMVPRFLDTLSSAITIANNVITALQPLWQWFWDNVLQPIATWTAGAFLTIWDGINIALSAFGEWCATNSGTIEKITTVVLGFFTAWEVTRLLAFIQMSGGVVGALTAMVKALTAGTLAKMADKIETIAITALYAKDFIVSVASATASLVKQAAQFAINTAAKLADAAAQGVMTAATVVWNGVCTIATTLTTALGAAISFLTSPIGLVIVAIGALIAIGVLLYKNWDVIKEKAAELKEWLVEKTHAMYESVTQVFENMKEKINFYAEKIHDWLVEKWNAVKDKTLEIWEKIKTTVSDKVNTMKNKVSKTINTLKTNISEKMEDIKSTFKGIISFLTGIFTGDWESAWNTVTETFKNIFDKITGYAKDPINGIIGMINALIDKVNSFITQINKKLSFEIGFSLPNWMGGGSYKYKHTTNIPTINSIPLLANGGFVEKNTPRLAVIGDNKHQGEIVSPEDKLQEMANAAAKAAGGTGISKEELESIINRAVMRIVAALTNMGFYLDSTQIAKATQEARAAMDIRGNSVEVV